MDTDVIHGSEGLSCDEEVSFARVEIGITLGNLILNVNGEVDAGLPFLCQEEHQIKRFFFLNRGCHFCPLNAPVLI